MGLAASRQEAFWEACGFGHVERVRKFLNDGDIDVNWVSYTHDCCPIHVASQGKPAIVKLLLDANCNVNVKDNRGNLPLHHAAMKGHSDIIQTLIEAGSDIDVQDKNGWTPLHCAAYWAHLDAVKVLVKNRADIHIQNKDERTALHESARSQSRSDDRLGEIATILIKAGGDVNAKSSDLGEADFTGLMFASYHHHPEVATAFIEGGCDINAHGTNLWTPLHWAADRGHDEMVFLLLEAGADPTKRGLRGELAADRAKEPEMKDILMNAVNMYEELAALDSGTKSQEKKVTDRKVNPHKGRTNVVQDNGDKTCDKKNQTDCVTDHLAVENFVDDDNNCSLDVLCDVDKTDVLRQDCVAPIAGQESSVVKGDNSVVEIFSNSGTLDESEKHVEYIATATAQIDIH